MLLSELGEQEDLYAQNLEDYRGVLKAIRNTESSVQPSRDYKAKTADEIAKLKYKDPSSTKLPQLEQELVRAEAQNLVAEAQLTNIVSFHSLQLFLVSSDPHAENRVDPSKAQRSLRHPLRRDHRARREAGHPRQTGPPPPEPPR